MSSWWTDCGACGGVRSTFSDGQCAGCYERKLADEAYWEARDKLVGLAGSVVRWWLSSFRKAERGHHAQGLQDLSHAMSLRSQYVRLGRAVGKLRSDVVIHNLATLRAAWVPCSRSRPLPR